MSIETKFGPDGSGAARRDAFIGVLSPRAVRSFFVSKEQHEKVTRGKVDQEQETRGR